MKGGGCIGLLSRERIPSYRAMPLPPPTGLGLGNGTLRGGAAMDLALASCAAAKVEGKQTPPSAPAVVPCCPGLA